ncbi:MAG: amino acid-binding protein [Thermoplasmatota archaeon]
MWEPLIEHFRRFPAQERVVRLLIRRGLRIQEGAIWAGEVAVGDSSVGRAAGVDRRVVRSAIEAIQENGELTGVFARFEPTLHLGAVAGRLGCGVVQIVPVDAGQPGILAGVTAIIAAAHVNIRQCIVEDPDFTDAAMLTIITQTPVPGHLAAAIAAVPGVASVRLA